MLVSEVVLSEVVYLVVSALVGVVVSEGVGVVVAGLVGVVVSEVVDVVVSGLVGVIGSTIRRCSSISTTTSSIRSSDMSSSSRSYVSP